MDIEIFFRLPITKGGTAMNVGFALFKEQNNKNTQN